MSVLDEIEFVKRVPAGAARADATPLEMARQNLLGEIDIQVQLLQEPDFVLRKTVNKRDGTTATKERRPRSWVKYVGDFAYITFRIANKPSEIRVGSGAVVKCRPEDVQATLDVLRRWAESEEADAVILEVIEKSRRKRGDKAGRLDSGDDDGTGTGLDQDD